MGPLWIPSRATLDILWIPSGALWMPYRATLDILWIPSGALWMPSGALWGPSGCPLGPLWISSGYPLGPSGYSMGPLWIPSRATLDILWGPSGCPLGTLWGPSGCPLGSSGCPLGTLWMPSGCPLDATRPILGRGPGGPPETDLSQGLSHRPLWLRLQRGLLQPPSAGRDTRTPWTVIFFIFFITSASLLISGGEVNASQDADSAERKPVVTVTTARSPRAPGCPRLNVPFTASVRLTTVGSRGYWSDTHSCP